MKYKDIIKRIAQQEQVTEKEVEEDMKAALRMAGLDCSVKEFIETAALLCQKKTIYSRIV